MQRPESPPRLPRAADSLKFQDPDGFRGCRVVGFEPTTLKSLKPHTHSKGNGFPDMPIFRHAQAIPVVWR